MKTFLIGWSSLVLAATQLWAANTEAVNDILKLQKAGVTEDVIIAYIRNHNVNYALTADDLIALKSQGITSAELNAMLESTSGAVASAPPAAPATVSTSVLAPASAPVEATQAPAPVQAPAQVVTTVAPAPTTVVVAPSPQSVYFYQELSPYGRWIAGDDGQWYWQPTVVITSPTWRPYWDNGSWINSDLGWYWSSEYPWGSVAFHYGRWHMHPRHGWVWMPGNEWGPAWVVWRGGDTYCGWAPLPPYARFDIHTGHYFYHDRMVAANFEFGLGFGHFNFCYVREMCERNRFRFHDERQARIIYNHTTIINNYGVEHDPRGHGDRIVNRGIDPVRIGERGGKPPERIRIEDHQGGPGGQPSEKIDRNNRTLAVYRPNVPEIKNVSQPGPGNNGNNQRTPGGGQAAPDIRTSGRDSRQQVLGQPSAAGRVTPAATPQATPNRIAPTPAGQSSVPSRTSTIGQTPSVIRGTPAATPITTPNRSVSGATTPARIQSQPATAPARQTITPAASPAQTQRPTASGATISRSSAITPPARSVQPAAPRMNMSTSGTSRGTANERQKSDAGRR
jgi:hypothetical protein